MAGEKYSYIQVCNVISGTLTQLKAIAPSNTEPMQPDYPTSPVKRFALQDLIDGKKLFSEQELL